jgi:hypothetical protein
MDLILILLFLGLFVGCPYVIWRTARKAFKLRNLQIADLEGRHGQPNMSMPNMPQPVAMPPGWYSDGNGGQRYWDGQIWAAPAPPQGQAS